MSEVEAKSTPRDSEVYTRQAANLESWFSSDRRRLSEPMPPVPELSRIRLNGSMSDNPELSFAKLIAHLYSLPPEQQLPMYLYICGFPEDDITSTTGSDEAVVLASEALLRYEASQSPRVVDDVTRGLGDTALQQAAVTPNAHRDKKPVVTTTRSPRRRAENEYIVSSSETSDEPDEDDLIDIEDEEKVESRVVGEDSRPMSTDGVRLYLSEIGKYPLLNAEQEVELAKAIEVGLFAQERLDTATNLSSQQARDLRLLARAGKRAHEKFMNSNLRLVVSIAKRYTGRGMAFLDIIQEGNLGLHRAVEKFDYTKGYKFSTYSSWWIRQAITRAMADQSRTIRLPVHLVEVVNKIGMIERELIRDLGREPTLQEIANELDMEPEKVEEILRHARPIASLDKTMREDDTSTLGDIIADPEAEVMAEDSYYSNELSAAVETVIATLSSREADIVRRRLGLVSGEVETLDSIAPRYGLTRERIRQIELKAMSKIRHPSRAYLLRGFWHGDV